VEREKADDERNVETISLIRLHAQSASGEENGMCDDFVESACILFSFSFDFILGIITNWSLCVTFSDTFDNFCKS